MPPPLRNFYDIFSLIIKYFKNFRTPKISRLSTRLRHTPPMRTLARSKVPERATLSAPCGALSPWPSAIGLHGDTPTLVTEWVWRCASCFFRPPLNLSTVESRRFRDAGLCAQVASVRRSSGRCLGCGAVGVSMDWPSPSSVGPTPPGTVPVWVYA